MSFAAVLDRLAKLENPYPGLRPFEPNEAHLFFGRDHQILDLCDRLARNRFVAVLGLSGSGKSSLVRAGLIPALERGLLLEPGLRWHAKLAKPAGAPFANLSATLGCDAADLRASSRGLIDHVRGHFPQGEGLLICIDQFEELFRYKDRAEAAASDSLGHASAASEAAAFIELLLASTRSPLPIYVVITMRTDYLGDCAEFPDFPEALNESQYLVPRLTREQRRQAIEGPLGRVRISSTLVERLLNEAGDEPDQLPILQHVLMRTWAQWRNSSGGVEQPIGREHYEAAGGFDGALDQHADELLNSKAVRAAPELVEIIFKRLTALSRGKRERRDPAPLSELWDLCDARSEEQRQSVREIVDSFRLGDATFLTPREGDLKPGTYIDIVHESLIRNWKVLAEKWLPEEEKQAKTLIELLDRARGWGAGKKEVLIGLDLSGAREWDARRNRSRKWAEHYVGAGGIDYVEAFLSGSWNEYEESERRAAQRRQRELRRTRRVAIVVGVAFIIATALGIYAHIQKVEADRARREAENQAASATSGRLATAALLNRETRPDLSALLSVEAERAADSFEARNSLLLSLQFNEGLISILRQSNVGASSLAFSPDGKTVASAGRTVRLWDVSSGQLIGDPLKGDSGRFHSIAFCPDGRILAFAGGTMQLWDVASRQAVGDPLKGHSGAVVSAAFSPDGKMLASASEDGTVRLWDVASRQAVGDLLKGDSSRVHSIAFSLDGKMLAVAGEDKTVRLWDVARREPLGDPMRGHAGTVLSLTFSPDGKILASASEDNTVRLWNVANQQPLGDALNGHASAVESVAFSPDGKMLASASLDATVRLWDAAMTPTPSMPRLSVPTPSPPTSSEIRSLWDPLKGHIHSVVSVAFSPDSKMLASADEGGTIRLWDVATGRSLAHSLKGHSNPVTSVAFSPAGKMLASASEDETVRLWDVASRLAVGDPLKGHSGSVVSVAFSPDGKMLASAGEDKTVRLWDVARRKPLGDPMRGHAGPVVSVAFSATGKMLASASGDATIRLWDVDRRQQMGDPLKGHSGPVLTIAFSPDGNMLASASGDATIRLWDVERRLQLGAPLKSHSNVMSIAFSPDGRMLASASGDQTVSLWHLTSRQPFSDQLTGRHSTVFIAFSPDGMMLAAASQYGAVQLWDLARRQPLGDPLTSHNFSIASVAFSPDGKMLAAASEDKTVWLWDVAPGSWATRLCRLANRNLSNAEWQQFVGPNPPYRNTCANLPAEGVPAR